AFDTVKQTKILKIIETKSVSSKLITFIKSFYRNSKAKIKTKSGISESFKISKGVLQGETLSPILFTIYLDGIIDRLHNSGTISVKILKEIVHILLYADDIILLA